MMTQTSPIDNGGCLPVISALAKRNCHVVNGGYASQRGFTLIELLLATTIGSMVLAAVYLTFSTALDSQRRIERVSVQTQESRFLFERIRNDIKNIVVADDGFSGTPDSLSFVSVPGNSGARKVQYRLRDFKQGSQLIRTSDAIADKSSVNPGDITSQSPGEIVVYEQLESLSFRYFIDGTWQTVSEGTALPAAIECKMLADGRALSFTFKLELDHVSIDAWEPVG